MPPAARVSDMTSHGFPLNPGPGSLNVMIGFMPAWRAVPIAAAAALQASLTGIETSIKALEATSNAAPEPVSKAAAIAAETAAKTAATAAMAAAMAATGADVHNCTMPCAAPVPAPHGPGVVLQASTTVVINMLPAARQGDKVVETLGGPDPIAMGCMTVIIG